MNSEDLLARGISAAKSGDREAAINFLADHIRQDPLSEEAWLWMGKCRESRQEKMDCYQRVLTINPGNAEAKLALDQLDVPGQLTNRFDFLPSEDGASIPELLHEHSITSDTPENSTESSSNQAGKISTSLVTPPSKKKIHTNRKILAILLGTLGGVIVFGGLIGLAISRGSRGGLAGKLISIDDLSMTNSLNPGMVKPTATVISTLTYSQRSKLAETDISEAKKLIAEQDYVSAILILDRVLLLVPEDAEWHYQRANAYYSLSRVTSNLNTFYQYYYNAIPDVDMAIRLDPQNGDYYYLRYILYMNLSTLSEMRVDHLKYVEIAGSNLEMALRYGTNGPYAERSLIGIMLNQGRNEEAIVETLRQAAELNDPNDSLDTFIGLAYFGKRDYEKALSYIDHDITIRGRGYENSWDRALILYAMERYEDAEEEISSTIETDPSGKGNRYYLRALIRIELGRPDEAEQDLMIGSGNIWEHGGMLPYAQGKLALLRGDTEAALEYFQYAEATYHSFNSPILERIREDLAALGGSPLEITPMTLEATIVPTPTVTITSHPTHTVDITPTP